MIIIEKINSEAVSKLCRQITTDFPYPNNANIYWMGILRDYQGKGIGYKLLEKAMKFAIGKGAITMTVETLAPSEADKNYLKTYKFYQSVGFLPLLNLKPQDYKWDMVYMLKIL